MYAWQLQSLHGVCERGVRALSVSLQRVWGGKEESNQNIWCPGQTEVSFYHLTILQLVLIPCAPFLQPSPTTVKRRAGPWRGRGFPFWKRGTWGSFILSRPGETPVWSGCILKRKKEKRKKEQVVGGHARRVPAAPPLCQNEPPGHRLG